MESNRLIFLRRVCGHQSISPKSGPYTRWGGDRLRGLWEPPVTARASRARSPLLGTVSGGPGQDNSREKTQHGGDQLHTKAAEKPVVPTKREL